MNLFQTYTGSAFLNQALITLQELSGKKMIFELSTSDILQAFERPYVNAPLSLTNINKRLKSYTMLFTTNGPLLNPTLPKLKREPIYNEVIKYILSNPEKNGDQTCEITGLRFNRPFQSFYEEALNKVGFKQNEIASKDTTINRCWFPLIGGLGSDAQALPQASFAVNIHPVCIAVLQFLPLSALLYKGGVLLIDSPDLKFTRNMIKYFVQRVKDEVAIKSSTATIENIKDYAKGDYLIKALEKLTEQEGEFASKSGFNFWSFSNAKSGKCLIDRIPNDLIRKLRLLYQDVYCAGRLKSFLQDSKQADVFISALENNHDYRGLYPAKKDPGVEIVFFERYQELIGNSTFVDAAKYIAHLLQRYDLSKDELKFLTKTDAYFGETRKRYTAIISKVLRDALEKKLWHPLQQLKILDDNEGVPVRSTFYNILPMVHYYFQKLELDEEIDVPAVPEASETDAYQTVRVFLFLLAEEKDERTKKQLMERGYQEVSLNELLWRTGSEHYKLEEIYPLIYDDKNRASKYGLRELLRLFLIYHEGDLSDYRIKPLAPVIELSKPEEKCLARLSAFSNSYLDYWKKKKAGSRNDLTLFPAHVLRPMVSPRFHVNRWLDEVLVNMQQAAKNDNSEVEPLKDKAFFSESLLYDATGEYNPTFARFAIAYNLYHLFYLTNQTKQTQHA